MVPCDGRYLVFMFPLLKRVRKPNTVKVLLSFVGGLGATGTLDHRFLGFQTSTN